MNYNIQFIYSNILFLGICKSYFTPKFVFIKSYKVILSFSTMFKHMKRVTSWMNGELKVSNMQRLLCMLIPLLTWIILLCLLNFFYSFFNPHFFEYQQFKHFFIFHLDWLSFTHVLVYYAAYGASLQKIRLIYDQL